MVGVPRSGGCHTCRRRKVKCDQQRPQCQRCQDDLKTCDGYERWATFINRTAAGGLQKRERLEEAIVPQMQNLSTGDVALKSADPLRPTGEGSGVSSSSEADSRSAAGPSTEGIRHRDTSGELAVPPHDRDLVQRFLDLYLPVSETDRAAGGPLCWMPVACRLPDPAPVLRLALYTLAASRVAYDDNDEVLGKESLRCYGETLKSLQRILSGPGSPDSKANDQVLTACQCLMIFELFGPAITSPKAAESHMKGLIRIAAMRKPDDFHSPSAAALLSDIRALDVVACIHDGTKSAFSAPEWRLKGEPTTVREAEHKLCDLALDLCTLFAEEKTAEAAELLDSSKIRDLVSRMDGWAVQFTNTLQMILDLSPKAPAGKMYGDVNSAVYGTWHSILILEVSIWAHEYLDQLAEDPVNESSSGQDKASPLMAPFFEGQEANWRDRVCQQTLDALEYVTRDEMGLFGAQVSIFPILMLLRLLPNDHPAYAGAAALYVRLVTRGVSNALNYPLPKGQAAADIEFWHRVGDLADASGRDWNRVA